MENHDKIRPQLPEHIQEGVVAPAEFFQNTVLRPIIKMQHDLLINHLSAKLHALKVEWTSLSSLAQRKMLNGLFLKDQAFKHEMIGMIIGQLNQDEYDDYLKEQKELNRRISQMVLERCSDKLVNSHLPYIRV